MEPTVFVPTWLDVGATAVGGVCGAVFALRENEKADGPHFDLMGVAVLALVMGLGGGVTRDVLLNLTPAALTNSAYLATALVAAAAGVLLGRVVTMANSLLVALDAASMGTFMVVGILKAERAGLDWFAAVIIGVIAGTAGGVIRDLLAGGRRPDLLQPGSLAGMAAVFGAVTFVVLDAVGLPSPYSDIIAGSVTFVVRMLSLWFGWKTAPVRAPTLEVRKLGRRRPPPDPTTRHQE